MYFPIPKDVRESTIAIFRGTIKSLPELDYDRFGNPVARFRVMTEYGSLRCYCMCDTATALCRGARIGQSRLFTAAVKSKDKHFDDIYGSSDVSMKILGWDEVKNPVCETAAKTAGALL